MRIAFVMHRSPPTLETSVERHTLGLANQLGRMGHRCTVIAPAAGSRGSEEPYAHAGAWVIPVAAAPADPPRPWLQERSVKQSLVRVLEEEGADVVHVMDPLGLPRVFSAARRLDLPVVAHVADFGYVCSRIVLRRRDGSLCVGADDGRACASACGVAAGPRRVEWGRSMLASADAAISPTRYAIDVFASQAFDTTRWHHVPRGIDYAMHPARLPAPGGDVLRIGFLGRLVDHEGARILVDAMQLLEDRSVELRLYGESVKEAWYETGVRELASGDDRVRFEPGPGGDSCSDVLRSLDAVAIPSLWHENLPGAGLDAVAAGVPLVVSDVGGLRELVDEYRCGFAFRTGSPESLAELLQQLLRDRAILAAVRDRMRFPPSLEEEAWAVERIYAEVEAARPRRRLGGRWRLAGRWR
jgi:glycosyltransferase involved in cell wall biosynthesis